MRTWVYETQEDGAISLGRDYPISGDPVFTMADGKTPSLPIGTYIIEETKEPTGYLLPSCQGRTFIEVVCPLENSDSEGIDTYHKEVYKPISTESGTLADGTSYTYTGLNWPKWKIDGE